MSKSWNELKCFVDTHFLFQHSCGTSWTQSLVPPPPPALHWAVQSSPGFGPKSSHWCCGTWGGGAPRRGHPVLQHGLSWTNRKWNNRTKYRCKKLCWGAFPTPLPSFPVHSHLQSLITCSSQIQRGEKAWEIYHVGRQRVDIWGGSAWYNKWKGQMSHAY